MTIENISLIAIMKNEYRHNISLKIVKHLFQIYFCICLSKFLKIFIICLFIICIYNVFKIKWIYYLYNRISINRFAIIWNFDHRRFRLFWLSGIFCLLKIWIYLKIEFLKIVIGNFFSLRWKWFSIVIFILNAIFIIKK